MLGAKAPILAASDIPAETVTGRYRAYSAVDAAELAQRPDRGRGCIDPGYTAEGSDAPGGPVSRIRVAYCPGPGEGEEALPLVEIRRNGAEFEGASSKGRAAIRLRRLREGLYLSQSDAEPGSAARFDLAVVRVAGGNLEVFALACVDFERAPREGALIPWCYARSFDAIRPELDAFADRIATGDRAPLLIFVREG